MDAFIDRLREALGKPLPGRPAQLRMAPEWRRGSIDPGADFRRSAVLVLLYPQDGSLRFPLIVRRPGPGPHGGQVALPGGALEAGETETEAALRETREELGIDCAASGVLGALTPLGIGVSRFRVAPIVACLPGTPEVRPSPAEVADWFPVALEELADARASGSAVVSHAGEEREAPCFRLSGRVVWGATAIVLAEFAEVVRTASARAACR